MLKSTDCEDKTAKARYIPINAGTILLTCAVSTIDRDLSSVCDYKDSAGAKMHRYSPECRAAVEVVRFGVYDVTILAPHRNPSCFLILVPSATGTEIMQKK